MRLSPEVKLRHSGRGLTIVNETNETFLGLSPGVSYNYDSHFARCEIRR